MNALPERLTVVSWAGGWGSALREAVSEPFQRETGVRVDHHVHVGLELPDVLERALRAGSRPPVDVVWSNSVPALQAAERGWALPLDPDEVPRLLELRDRARPAHALAWSVVHPYVVYYVLAYHEEACPDGAPRSWRALFDPRHKGKIALYPGGNGFYPIAQVLGGGRVEDIPDHMDACWACLRELRPQIGELDYSIGMERRLTERRLDLCFRALTNALAFRAAGIPVGWSVPLEGTADTLDALWVPRGLPEAERALAMRYIDFALRREVQQDWCERLGAMPMHPEAAVPTALRHRADLPEHADDHRGILRVPEHVKVRHQRAWEAKVRCIFA